MDVISNLEHVQKKIEQACENSKRNPKDIKVIAVTKYVTIERTKETLASGIHELGENRDSEFLKKYNEVDNESVHWHFIGTLQSRKVKDVINKVTAIHSLDRISLAKEINKRAENTIDCFVQVNVSGEEAKHGLHPEEVLSFIEKIAAYDKIRVVGLMTMAPHVEDETVLRDVFQKLANLKEELKQKQFTHAPLDYLSMGMSNDYQIAIEEGATHIRIGSELVGPYEK